MNALLAPRAVHLQYFAVVASNVDGHFSRQNEDHLHVWVLDICEDPTNLEVLSELHSVHRKPTVLID